MEQSGFAMPYCTSKDADRMTNRVELDLHNLLRLITILGVVILDITHVNGVQQGSDCMLWNNISPELIRLSRAAQTQCSSEADR